MRNVGHSECDSKDEVGLKGTGSFLQQAKMEVL